MTYSMSDDGQNQTVTMSGPSGTHTIDASEPQRVLAHWRGFCEVNGQPVDSETVKAVRVYGLARCFYAAKVPAQEWIQPGVWGFTPAKRREYDQARLAGLALMGR